VIRLELSAQDVSRTRLSFSPLWEAVFGFRAMAEPARHGLHLPWIAEARREVANLDLPVLRALVQVTGAIAGFLLPLPDRASATLEEELDRLQATPGDQVVGAVDAAFGSGAPPPLTALVERPRQALARIAHEIEEYWDAALAPHWATVGALLQSEVLHAAIRHVEGGSDAFLGGLHPAIRWDGRALEVRASAGEGPTPDGRGVVLVATVFAWPDVLAGGTRDGLPVLAYPARGAASLWPAVPPDRIRALELLLGRERAAVLESLGSPRSTTDLARVLGIAPSSASYHLGVLREARLIDRLRSGREVLYRLSPLGVALLGLWEGPERAALAVGPVRRGWSEPGRDPRADLSKSLESFSLPRPPF
jgi:DNA-binding transcriptional ArsR family regulator